MRWLVGGTLLWVVFAFGCLWIATSQPWLGLVFQPGPQPSGLRVVEVFPESPSDGKLRPGDIVTQLRSSSGASIELVARDIISTPTYLPRYAQHGEFLARQQTIADIVRSGTVRMQMADGREVEIRPAPRRPLRAIPLPALLQFTVLPALALLIGFTVLHRRAADPAARYLLGCALGYTCLVSDALYAKRELALPEDLFRALLAFENLGGLVLMGGSAVAVLWNFPAPLTRRPGAPWIYAVAIAGAAAHKFHFFETVTFGFWMWCLLSFAAQAIVAAFQWRRARGRPAHRAMLKWLIVPWFALAGMYTALFYIPASAGLGPQAPQFVGWSLFLLIFVGLALGLTRFRLYYLNPANLLVWFLDGVLIVALLSLGLYVLDWPYFAAGCLALTVTGLLHTLVRDAIWSAQALRNADFGRVLKSVLETLGGCRSATEARASWSRTLQHLFEPRAITTSTGASTDDVAILDDGERMQVPVPSGSGALVLELPFRGRGLFMPRDARAVQNLYRIFDAVVRYWESHQRGESDERLRLSRTLDAGLDHSLARLVELAPTPESRNLAENARAELRRLSRSLAEPPRPLSEVMQSLREETEARCMAGGVRPLWREEVLPNSLEVSGQWVFDLQSIVREAVTNSIRHSGGTTLQVEVRSLVPETLELSVEDDGVGRPEAMVRGRGMGNMRRRAEFRGGSLGLETSELGGLCVRVRLQIKPAE